MASRLRLVSSALAALLALPPAAAALEEADPGRRAAAAARAGDWAGVLALTESLRRANPERYADG
ncbi:MAG TPA: hypothetical protein VLH41_10645, partial [Thermoanaerobaculia bacterium]|nr:hypothetical protein [Thermoanaerobaculia bacterium]